MLEAWSLEVGVLAPVPQRTRKLVDSVSQSIMRVRKQRAHLCLSTHWCIIALHYWPFRLGRCQNQLIKFK